MPSSGVRTLISLSLQAGGKGGGAHLLRDALLHLEQGVEPSGFDPLEERGGDVHVRVEGVFPRRELGEGSDRCSEVGGVRSHVTFRDCVNFHCRRARREEGTNIWDRSLMSPTPVDLVISLASDLYL